MASIGLIEKRFVFMLLTQFVRIGLSGATVDGRTISAEWLTQAAANYSLDKYTANINYEHRTYYGSLGRVIKLETREEADGKTGLYATLNPSAELMYLNSQGQKLFTSMELNLDFADSGEAYLQGLAVTDNPASLGTQKLEFSADTNQKTFVSDPEETAPIEIIENTESHSENDKSFIKKLGEVMGFNVTEKKTTPGNNPEQETAAMTEQQFNALSEALTNIAARLPVAAGANEEPEKPVLLTADQGQELLTKIEGLEESNTALTEKLNTALTQEKPGTQHGEHENGEDDKTTCY